MIPFSIPAIRIRHNHRMGSPEQPSIPPNPLGVPSRTSLRPSPAAQRDVPARPRSPGPARPRSARPGQRRRPKAKARSSAGKARGVRAGRGRTSAPCLGNGSSGHGQVPRALEKNPNITGSLLCSALNRARRGCNTAWGHHRGTAVQHSFGTATGMVASPLPCTAGPAPAERVFANIQPKCSLL